MTREKPLATSVLRALDLQQKALNKALDIVTTEERARWERRAKKTRSKVADTPKGTP